MKVLFIRFFDIIRILSSFFHLLFILEVIDFHLFFFYLYFLLIFLFTLFRVAFVVDSLPRIGRLFPLLNFHILSLFLPSLVGTLFFAFGDFEW